MLIVYIGELIMALIDPSLILILWWGVGGEPKIVAKRDPSISNSAWESIFQMNMNFHFTIWTMNFLNIFEYLAGYSIQMDRS